MKAHLSTSVLKECQLNAVRLEMEKVFACNLERYNREAALQVMFILRFTFGFGQQRLEKFAEELKKMQDEIVDFYELQDDDRAFFAEIKLKESGIDVDKILRGDECESGTQCG